MPNTRCQPISCARPGVVYSCVHCHNIILLSPWHDIIILYRLTYYSIYYIVRALRFIVSRWYKYDLHGSSRVGLLKTKIKHCILYFSIILLSRCLTRHIITIAISHWYNCLLVINKKEQEKKNTEKKRFLKIY